MSVSLLSLLLACRVAPAGDADTEAWDDRPAVALEPLRLLMSVTLSGSSDPSEITALGPDGGLGVLDDSQVFLLDAHYGNSTRSFCVSTTSWEDWGTTDHNQELCDEGTVYLRRGLLMSPNPTVAFSVDTEQRRIAAIDSSGQVFARGADPLREDPFDYLNTDEITTLSGLALSGQVALKLGLHSGGFDVLTETELLPFDNKGLLTARTALPGTGRDLARWGEHRAVATDAGLLLDDTLLDIPGQHLAVDGTHLWVADTAGQSVYRVDDTGAAIEIPIAGLTGPVTASGGRIAAAVEGGVAIATASGEVLRADTPAEPIDVAMIGPYEVAVLGSDGVIDVFFDEASLTTLDRAPLNIWVSAFVERPRKSADEVPCGDSEHTSEADETVWSFAARAARNAELLDDTPAAGALGLTPELTRRLPRCGAADTFEPVWNHARREVGVLFHELTDTCTPGDADCLDAHLSSELNTVAALTGAPTWVSGLSTASDAGLEWPASLARIDAPDAYLFFGMSLLAEIDHTSDPRAKDAWPAPIADSSVAWRAGDIAAIDTPDPNASLSLYPGDNIPAFNLSDCHNLFLLECHRAAAGGGVDIDRQDVVILDLLLHRALAAGSSDPDAPRSWTFHLPDLGVYDYTTGCAVDDRTWSGSDCQGARLQTWLLDVHDRWVSSGLARWSLPSELVRP